MSRWKQKTHAWAIMNTEGELLGPFYFATEELKSWHGGCRTALFRTRKQARDALADKHYKDEMQVVKVRLEIWQVGAPRRLTKEGRDRMRKEAIGC